MKTDECGGKHRGGVHVTISASSQNLMQPMQPDSASSQNSMQHMRPASCAQPEPDASYMPESQTEVKAGHGHPGTHHLHLDRCAPTKGGGLVLISSYGSNQNIMRAVSQPVSRGSTGHRQPSNTSTVLRKHDAGINCYLLLSDTGKYRIPAFLSSDTSDRPRYQIPQAPLSENA
jgi:hypothetical protein